MTGGCRFPWPHQPAKVESHPSPAAIDQYRQAMTSYQTGDYELAAKRFAAIREQTPDSDFARMALYALACSRIMVAQTPEEYHMALLLWQRWTESAPDDFESENPVLLNPLMKKKMIFSNIPLTPDEAGEIEPGPAVPRWLLIQTKQELERLQKQLEKTERTLKKRQDKIKALQKEIGGLKHQIKALETIDQKIQKKKDAIPSVDPSTPTVNKDGKNISK